jgi:hypothetical protein
MSCCGQAYNILRHSAGLLLSLLHLMAGAPVTDLAADPSKALLKLQVGLLASQCRAVLSTSQACGTLFGCGVFGTVLLLYCHRPLLPQRHC